MLLAKEQKKQDANQCCSFTKKKQTETQTTDASLHLLVRVNAPLSTL